MATHIGPGGMIARFTGKIFVALGFILGIYGLTEGQPPVMQTGLGLLPLPGLTTHLRDG